tara:strand:+ start:700 stop:945 length:246 start_codon:yes stop_codon:yes gene_type:complete
MTSQEKKIMISKETLMPLGMVVALCSGVVWISSQLTNINYKLDALENKLENNWTTRDMENWGLRLKLQNPTVSVPDTKPKN